MPLPVPRTPQEEKVVADLERYGWHCVFVRGDDDPILSATVGYTVGLWERHDHPELVVTGAWPQAHAVLTGLVDQIAAGRRFTAGEQTDGVELAPVSVRRRYELLRLAHWAAGSEPFDALQVVLPDDERTPQPRLA